MPTALLLLNAQLDGIVALGIGAAFALWSRPFLAGLALGLTLVKPQLVLPLGAALLVAPALARPRRLGGRGRGAAVSRRPLEPAVGAPVAAGREHRAARRA